MNKLRQYKVAAIVQAIICLIMVACALFGLEMALVDPDYAMGWFMGYVIFAYVTIQQLRIFHKICQNIKNNDIN